VSLPGAVTGAVRKGWNVLGCLSLANPEVLDEQGNVRTKTEIREITHLHHALDACVLAFAARFLPNPKNGRIWELMVKRRLSPIERPYLERLPSFKVTDDGKFQLLDLQDKYKEQIRQRLAERRVVQHIPARMDGLRAEQNTWRVASISDGGEATLLQHRRGPDGKRTENVSTEKLSKLIGPNPKGGDGKLKRLKGALVIPDNYGVALDPKPAIIPFHKVPLRLRELREANGGNAVRVIRNGQLILVPCGKFEGVWKVFSAKNNSSGMALDIGRADVVRLKNKTEGHKINVLLASLIRYGLTIARCSFTGVHMEWRDAER
jgi:CRISPR-associated endonuclease Csn1